MKSQQKRAKAPTFSTDVLMKGIWCNMVRDFRNGTGESYHKVAEALLLSDVKLFRGYNFPFRSQVPPWLFKQEVQLENLFKRYRFKNDLYSDEELSAITLEKFEQLQIRLARHQWRQRTSESTFRIVQHARRIVQAVLSSVDLCEAYSLGRFSTRATVGCPAGDAYLDHKLAGELTGSHDHIRDFISILADDNVLSRTVEKCSPPGGPIYRVCESLPLIGVPKSYKSERLIMPNTLIGSYITYGYGKLIVKALKEHGLDIRTLQERHRKLAKKFSRSKKYVTADLSSASESFTWPLMCKLLPRKWLKALDRGRLRYYNHPGSSSKVYYLSFMAMGIGFTFPLQTLLFYALVESIRVLLKVKGFVSVYGDDLIYPTEIHGVVEHLFDDLGFQLNRDKTFVESNFRESCGGDYFHGVDVRPFQPEGVYQELLPRRYEAHCYKLYNGLLSRWPEDLLPLTYKFLRDQILLTKERKELYQVPPSYPDTSGIRVSKPIDCSPDPYVCVFSKFTHGAVRYSFKHLRETPQHRYVSFIDAYYWDSLRILEQKERDVPWSPYDSSSDIVVWQKTKPVKRYRGYFGRRVTKRVAVTTCKLRQQKIQISVTDSIADWI